MLVLRRKEGQWIDITHRSGDILRFRVYEISGEKPGRVNIAFDDIERNFSIQRPERFLKGPHFNNPEVKTDGGTADHQHTSSGVHVEL